MSEAERAELADLDREMTALQSAARAWDRYKALRDGDDNVAPLTSQERAALDAMLEEIA